MASLQLRGGSWRILFNYKAKQLTFVEKRVPCAQRNGATVEVRG
jgi:hypothetical protein